MMNSYAEWERYALWVRLITAIVEEWYGPGVATSISVKTADRDYHIIVELPGLCDEMLVVDRTLIGKRVGNDYSLKVNDTRENVRKVRYDYASSQDIIDAWKDKRMKPHPVGIKLTYKRVLSPKLDTLKIRVRRYLRGTI